MQIGPYSFDDALRIHLALIERGVNDLQATGDLRGPPGASAQRELGDLLVYHSAALQGNSMTLDQVRAVVYDHAVLEGPSRLEQREVVNLENGLEYVRMLVEDDVPLTERLIRIMHALVMRGLLPPEVEPGTYRTEDLPDLAYGPPAAHAVTAEMGTFARWLATKPDAPTYAADPLVRGAVAHTWLLVVHPFLNGNGRVARLMLNLILLRAGYPLCVVHAEDRPDYMAALAAAGLHHDLNPILSLLISRMHDSLAWYGQGE